MRYVNKLTVGGKTYSYVDLKQAYGDAPMLLRLPYALRVILENVVRHNPRGHDPLRPFVTWIDKKGRGGATTVRYFPSRVLMQDFSGIPVLLDLASMRDALVELGKAPKRANPVVPSHLVVDHSVSVDFFGSPEALVKNEEKEYTRNGERYRFLKWAQDAFQNITIVPPAHGICHQLNIEYFTELVRDRGGCLIPDTCIGTDSHTTMVGGMGVLGWGVGGIEAESVLLGEAIDMILPEVVGVRLENMLPKGTTATDLALTVTERLRKEGVVGKIVEFCGPGG